jgi:hypothetical protein
LHSALAQEGEEEFLVLNPNNGRWEYNIAALTPAGVRTVETNTGTAIYNTYSTPEGYTVVIASSISQHVGESAEVSPFVIEPFTGTYSGSTSAGEVFFDYSNLDPNNPLLGYTGELELTTNLSYWAELSLEVQWNSLFNTEFNQGHSIMAGTILVFDGAPFAEEEEIAEAPPPPAPPPIARACPTPQIIQQDIIAYGELIDPPYPVVVGQDDANRGADIMWTVEVPPTTYIYYDQIVEGGTCRYVGDGSGSGCPGPDTYDSIVGAGSWQSWMARDNDWDVTGAQRIRCVRRTQSFTEQIVWWQTLANLTAVSRDWILGDLAVRYPGASLYRPDWLWFPGSNGYVRGDGTFVVEWIEERVQFQDPGTYDMSVMGFTTGTPVTESRYFELPAGGFDVWLHEAALSQ